MAASTVPLAPRAPYPGLRPFREDESDIFFGRERQTDELLARLQRKRFIAVTGPSGCGKSSLVRAGVIPALHSGFMAKAGARWRICEMRPGDKPIRALANALAAPEIVGTQGDEAARATYIEAALRFGPLGLAEVVRESPEMGDAALFLLVDQFEEIFRFRERIDPDEAEAFVRLLLETTGQPDVPAYIVITMRSDYLGDCTVFHGLPEAINESQYLTPRLTRDECGQAIRGPARVFRGDVDAALLNHLLNDFGPDPDQLPLLQHALMRMWWRKATALASATARERVILTLDDYTERLGEALDRHADEVLAELMPDQQRLAEVMFRRLTERARSRRDTRAPALLSEVAAIAGAGEEGIARVVEVFRREGCNFVVAGDGSLHGSTLLDIGHESLIRQWKTLSKWVDAEAESAATYRRLTDAARRNASGEAPLLRGRELDLALAWLERERPNEAWAERYRSSDARTTGAGTELRRVLAFLDESRRAWDDAQAREREREAAERQRAIDDARRAAEADAARAEANLAQTALDLERAEKLAERRRQRNVLLTAGAVVLLIAVFGLVGRNAYMAWLAETTEESFVDFKLRYGVPEGVGPLTKEQAARRAVSYVITTAGRGPNRRVIRMRAVSASGELTAEHSASSSALAEEDAPLGRKAVQWQFFYDQDGNVASEVASDRRGRQVHSVVYFSSEDRDQARKMRTRQMIGPNGFALPRKQLFCATTETVEYSKEGFDWRYRFSDRFGEPVPGRDNALVQERRRNPQGFEEEFVSLNRELERMNDRAGNASVQYSDFNAFGEARRAEYRGADEKLVEIDGWAIQLMGYDDAGNITEVSYFDRNGRPTHSKEGYHRQLIEYGDGGLVSRRVFWAEDGKPATQVDYCHELRLTREGGRYTGGTCIGVDGRPTSGRAGAPQWRIEYDADGNQSAWSYWDAAGRRATHRSGFHRIEMKFDPRGNLVATRYYNAELGPARVEKGHTAVKYTYDVRNHEISRVYYGPDGASMITADGYAELRRTYDQNGDNTSERYYGADGKTLVRQADGYAGMNFKNDDCGREIERWYVGPDGKPMTIAQGYAGEHRDYDELGRVVGLSLLSPDAHPTINNEGVSGWRDMLDRFGHIVERHYFGANGRRVPRTDGEGGWRSTYDSRGYKVSEDHIDSAGKLVATGGNAEDGRFARIVWQRNPLGDILEETYLGPHGEPVNVPEGYSKLKYTRDATGAVVEMAFYAGNGAAVVATDGAHRVRLKHNARGHVVERRYFGLHDEPIVTTGGFHSILLVVDEHGLEVDRRYLGLRGEPALGPKGWHASKIDRDALGRVERRSYWGIHDGDRVMIADGGYHAITYRYDANGRVTERQFRDKQLRLTPGPEGAPRVRSRYDTRGREVETTFDDGQGDFVRNISQVAKIKRRYDERGRLVEEVFFGRGDGMVNWAGEYAKRTLSYDDRVREEHFERSNGAPYAYGKNSDEEYVAYAKRVTRYDSFGREIETTYLGADGRPVGAGDGWWARLAREYDGLGREIAVTGYRPDQALRSGLKFEIRRLRRYDAYGRVVVERYVDADVRPIKSNSGASRVVRRYDVHGWMVEERYYDESNQPVGRDGSLAAIVKMAYDLRGHETLRRFFDARLHPVKAPTDAGWCAALRWQRDALGRTRISAGECLDEQLRPIAR